MIHVASQLVENVAIPKFFKIKQKFPRPVITPEEIPGIISSLLSEEKFSAQVKPGMRIAITAGSRGVANVAVLTKAIADFCKSRGAHPFVVPAMGSHGGATAEGQKEVLTNYCITEDFVGCPILSSMEVTHIGYTEDGRDVYIDKNAAEADGIIISCRIKPHTAFRGTYESGIMKMMAIGIAKQAGAERCHDQGFKNMAKNVPLYGKAILKNANILFAVPTLENAYDETCKIVAVNHDEVEEMEPPLLQEAYSYMPRILVDDCDVLVVDEIGKNFSGDGMDPNITGTFCTPYASGGIKSQRVCVLDLAPETHGNGIGVGMANATTQRVYRQLDLDAMYTNAITCTVLHGARIPCVMNTDKEAIQICIRTCIEIDKTNPKIVRIPNSLHIEHILLSEAYYELMKDNPNIEIESEPAPLSFDTEGNLTDIEPRVR